MPREITHTHRLIDTDALLDRFFAEVAGLGPKLGCILVQFPPSLAFDARVALSFVAALRHRFGGAVALEPRHATWFTLEANRLLIDARIARVAADPSPVGAVLCPAGWPGLVYYRLHGSPIVYYSTYDHEYLTTLTAALDAHQARGSVVWCVFDNTARGAATDNALDLWHQLKPHG